MKETFGILPSGENTSIYTISCGGLTAAVTDYGAALVKLLVPDRDGVLADVVLGYDDCNGYRTGTCFLGATVGRTRDIGLAEGESLLAQDARLKMSYLARESQIAVGDLVVTTGLGGIFPAGLVVGTVEDVLPETSGKSMYAVITPAADVRTVTSVFIITDYDPETAVPELPVSEEAASLEEAPAEEVSAHDP